MKFAEDTRQLDWMRRPSIDEFAALIVGAGSGMGAACARTFAANGGRVVVADIHLTNAERVADEIAAAGGYAVAIKLDVADQADIDAGVAKAVETYGRLDVLINTAMQVCSILLEDVNFEEWKRIFQINTHAALALALACRPYLKKSPAPSIVHVASLAGTHGYANSGPYGPSKAALITLSRQMALEWAVDNIRVNVIIPGTIMTPAVIRDITEIAMATRTKQVPLGRLSLPSEQADVAVFLASPQASFVTGQTFTVDGGFSINLFPQPQGMSESMRERAERLAREAAGG